MTDAGPGTGFGDWPQRMSAADSMFFKGESNPRTCGTGHFIYVLDSVPEWDRFVAVWDRASRVFPPLYKRVVKPTARAGCPSGRTIRTSILGSTCDG